MWIIWVFLAPLLVVAGAGLIAAALFVVYAFAAGLLGGPISFVYQKVRWWRALQVERKELRDGRWVPLQTLRERGLEDRYDGFVEFAECVQAAGRNRWQVAVQSGEPVILCHRGLLRVITVGEREFPSPGHWLADLSNEFRDATTSPVLQRLPTALDELQDAVREANKFLPEPVTIEADDDPRSVLAAVRGRVGYEVFDEPGHGIMALRFSEFCTAVGAPYIPLRDMEHLLPDAEKATGWYSASEWPADEMNEDGTWQAEYEPRQLYLDGERYVEIRFSLKWPWILCSYSSAAAYLNSYLLIPEILEYEISSMLWRIDSFPDAPQQTVSARAPEPPEAEKPAEDSAVSRWFKVVLAYALALPFLGLGSAVVGALFAALIAIGGFALANAGMRVPTAPDVSWLIGVPGGLAFAIGSIYVLTARSSE